MKKQIILLSLFLVFGLFSGPIQAANLDDLEICPNPDLRKAPPAPWWESRPELEDFHFPSSSPWWDAWLRSEAEQVTGYDPWFEVRLRSNPDLRNQASDSSSGRINPLPKEENGETLPENEALKEGYSCKVATQETRPGLNGGYEGGGYVQWTLVKKEDNKEVWAAHTEWGLIYVGDVEDGTYTFQAAKWLCRDKELVINGEKIKMTLPAIAVTRRVNIEKRPILSFEFLAHLNYESVVPNRKQTLRKSPWLWSSEPYPAVHHAWRTPVTVGSSAFMASHYDHSVRCVGPKKEEKPSCGCE